MLSIEVEAQPVPQETTKDHKTQLLSATTVKQRQREGTEPNKETVRERKRRVQQTPEERTTDRSLGAPSPATVPAISYRSRDTRGEILGKEHQEKTDEQRSPQQLACCGELNCPSVTKVLEESEMR